MKDWLIQILIDFVKLLHEIIRIIISAWNS